MDVVENILKKVDDIRNDLLLLLLKKRTLPSSHDCTEHQREIESCKKEIRDLNHMIDEQECEIRALSKKLRCMESGS